MAKTDEKNKKEEVKTQKVEREQVIENAAREQSAEGKAPDVTPVSERAEGSEDPKPKEEKAGKGKSSDPVTGTSNRGVTEYAPGQHPKHRQIADKEVSEAPKDTTQVEVVDSK